MNAMCIKLHYKAKDPQIYPQSSFSYFDLQFEFIE